MNNNTISPFAFVRNYRKIQDVSLIFYSF